MKKRNPIRDTVTTFVAKRKRIPQKDDTTKFKEFFEDLQNRGPMSPNSLYERWTIRVREEMQEEGTWRFEFKDEFERLEFVVEYVSRLQRVYWDSFPSKRKNLDHIAIAFRAYEHAFLQTRTFRSLYKKMRVWGLRMKIFGLTPWTTRRTLIAYVRRYERDSISGNLLYSTYQQWSAWHFTVTALNRSLRIDPKGIKIEWRHERKY